MSADAPHPAVAGVPIASSERIALFDILRGLALFGMILVHFHQKMRLPAQGIEDLVSWGVYMLVEQKAWGIFAFLFGAGFAVLLGRLDARGIRVVPLYLRRLAALAIFGMLAYVGFGFTILYAYAFWGVALLFMRRWSTRTLLIMFAVAVCASLVLLELRTLHTWWTGAQPSRPGTYALPLMQAQGNYLALLGARWVQFVAHLPHSWRDFIPDMNLALFILGLLAVRHRVLEEPKRHRRLIAAWMTFGGLSWAVAWLVELVVRPRLPKLPAPYMEYPLLSAFGFVADQWLCLTYIGGVTLLLAYRPAWTRRLALFGQAGRMALSNYMLQIAVLDVLASGYGFALKLRPYVYVVAAGLLFGVEVVFSRLWLARYRFGPLEWVWRTVTYLRWQPLVREAPQRPGAVALGDPVA